MKNWIKITVFTDGSCYYKTRQGGIGVYIIDNKGKEYFYQKGYCDTTISRCELRAFLTALILLDKEKNILATIYSDSQYVVNNTLNNLRQWFFNDWKGCENADLWKKIKEQLDRKRNLRIKLHWIKGHSKDLTNEINYGNTVADMLANYKQFTEYETDIKE